MIPVGKCRCMNCNGEFYAYEALYKLDLMPLIRRVNAAHNSASVAQDSSIIEDDFLGLIDDTMDDNSDNTDIPTEIKISVKEIFDQPHRIIIKNGVRIRLLEDKTTAISGNCCEQLVKKIGEYPIYKVMYFGCTWGNYPEQAIEGNISERYCPHCESLGKESQLGESMGMKDSYLLMMFGNSYVGKTTWLESIFELNSQSNVRIMDYTITNQDNNETKWTKNNIKRRHTPNNASQTDLCAWMSLARNTEEICIIFRDVAGENLRHDNKNRDQALEARSFAKYADGILIFRDVTRLPRIIERLNRVPEGYPDVSDEEYKLAVENYMVDIKDSTITEDLQEYKDVGQTIQELHISEQSLPAVFYVLNKSDLLRQMMNHPLSSLSNDEDEKVIMLDYRCNVMKNDSTVLTSDSSMFSDVSHFHEFNIHDYLECALETNNFASKEDSAFCAMYSQFVQNKGFRHGITCISSNASAPNRIYEPLAWMLEALINNNGFDFRKSIVEQYAALDS